MSDRNYLTADQKSRSCVAVAKLDNIESKYIDIQENCVRATWNRSQKGEKKKLNTAIHLEIANRKNFDKPVENEISTARSNMKNTLPIVRALFPIIAAKFCTSERAICQGITSTCFHRLPFNVPFYSLANYSCALRACPPTSSFILVTHTRTYCAFYPVGSLRFIHNTHDTFGAASPASQSKTNLALFAIDSQLYSLNTENLCIPDSGHTFIVDDEKRNIQRSKKKVKCFESVGFFFR